MTRGEKRKTGDAAAFTIKFVLLLIIFPVSFSVTQPVINWRLSQEFWSLNIFSTRHGDQNGHSFERCKVIGAFLSIA